MALLEQKSFVFTATIKDSVTLKNLDCDILITAMHSYSEEFLESFSRIICVKNGEVWEESK